MGEGRGGGGGEDMKEEEKRGLDILYQKRRTSMANLLIVL